MGRILIYHHFGQNHIEYLKEKYPKFELTVCNNIKDVFQYLGDTEAYISSRFDKEMLDAAPCLKWVQAMSAGVDSMPLEEMKQRGIVLTNGRGIHKIHMSEYAIASMILLARNFHLMFRNQIAGKWDRVPQGEIYGSTLGIIGIGSIGREIAKRASFLGMHVIGVKNNPEPVEFVESVYGMDDIAKVLGQSDYVINLLPSTPGTHKMIDKKFFNQMKDTACFINIGRGRTVNEDDLIEALINKTIKAAVLDVYHNEPLPEDSPLWKLQNVLLTPHICGESEKYIDRAMEIITHNLDVYSTGNGTMINVIDYSKRY